MKLKMVGLGKMGFDLLLNRKNTDIDFRKRAKVQNGNF